jgi:hypothetical protein
MTFPFSQPGANVYTQGFGPLPETLTTSIPHIDVRAPTSTDVNYPVGKTWLWPNNSTFVLLNLLTTSGVTSATWAPISSTVTTVTAAASPQTDNSRVGSVTFSGVSIAAAATQTFVINNSNILSSSTVVLYSMSGSTTGAAPTIESITNAAGSSSIVVTNGTGATTQTGNLTFTYQILTSGI